MQDQTNELRAHLKEKELQDGEGSPLPVTLADGKPTGGHQPIGEQTSGVTYELLSENAEGEVRRTHAAGLARRHAEEPEYALV
jgi:hypothetical protein